MINEKQIIAFRIALHQCFLYSGSAVGNILITRYNIPASCLQLVIDLFPSSFFWKHKCPPMAAIDWVIDDVIISRISILSKKKGHMPLFCHVGMAFKHHVPIADGFSINIIYPSGNYVKKGAEEYISYHTMHHLTNRLIYNTMSPSVA